MASLRDKVPNNVFGKYYVDRSCIYCDVCRDTAPNNFEEVKEAGWARVVKQPSSIEEEILVREAMECCPTSSIGDNGDQCILKTPDSKKSCEIEFANLASVKAELLLILEPWAIEISIPFLSSVFIIGYDSEKPFFLEHCLNSAGKLCIRIFPENGTYEVFQDGVNVVERFFREK